MASAPFDIQRETGFKVTAVAHLRELFVAVAAGSGFRVQARIESRGPSDPRWAEAVGLRSGTVL